MVMVVCPCLSTLVALTHHHIVSSRVKRHASGGIRWSILAKIFHIIGRYEALFIEQCSLQPAWLAALTHVCYDLVGFKGELGVILSNTGVESPDSAAQNMWCVSDILSRSRPAVCC